MLHSNINVMTIHISPTSFTVSREVPLDFGRCHGFTGFFLQLCSDRYSFKTCLYVVTSSIRIVQVFPEVVGKKTHAIWNVYGGGGC